MTTRSQRRDTSAGEDPHTLWLAALEGELSILDDAPLECDGMTYAISYLMQQAGIPHVMYCGFAKDKWTGDVVMPHCWIEIDGGLVVDYRLRMWLGHDDRIPHGIFKPSDSDDIEYSGTALSPHSIGIEILIVMTEGLISHAKVPPSPESNP